MFRYDLSRRFPDRHILQERIRHTRQYEVNNTELLQLLASMVIELQDSIVELQAQVSELKKDDQQ